MISQYTIENEWVKITNAGEIGTCWVENVINGINREGRNLLRVYHTKNGTPDKSLKNHGYPVRDPETNFDSVQLIPDDNLDIFYAISDTPDTRFVLTVDVRVE